MLNTPNPEACAYHLAHHPEMLTRLWSLESSGNGIQAMKELNDLSTGLRFTANASATGAPSAARRERQANPGPPPPIKPLGGGGHSAGPSVNDKDIDYPTYKRLMAERARSRGESW